jgi:TolA-binding protein
MKHKSIAVLIAIICLGIVGAVLWYLSQPHSATDQLERARRIEARNASRLPTAKDASKRETLIAETLDAYSKVGEKYPKSPEAEEADYRAMQIHDENSTGTTQRKQLYSAFLKKYPKNIHAADLKWKSAEITQKEEKKYLEAIKLYEEFARDFPKDERVAEARFRIGNIYEEIREFPKAVEAYKKLVADSPKSKFADEAQFRIGNLLAEKLEKKQEAAEAFAKIEKNFPGSRFAAAAGGERKKLSEAAASSRSEKYHDDYYGGVKEVSPVQRASDEANTPPMQRLRAQPVDLLHEDIQAEVVPADHTLSATVTMLVRATADTTSTLIAQLGAPLKVLSVRRGSNKASFSSQGNLIYVDLSEPLSAGKDEAFTLSYSGVNSDTWSGDIITSASTYLMNRNWLPVLSFGDNYTANIDLVVPAGYLALSQGKLASTEQLGNMTRFHYVAKQPVYFYIMVTAPYSTRSVQYKSKSSQAPEFPISVNLFKGTDPKYFDGYLKEIPPILDYYESLFGAFPYPKLSIAQVNYFPGGLGSPGLIMLGDKAFTKPGVPANFLAHEIAHTWFGNELTLDLSENSIPWLSEGFAQYMDALYHEHRDGHAAFVQHMRTLAENYYETSTMRPDKPIKGTSFADPMYSSLTYDKGAFVLNALRGVMGDEHFMKMLRGYVSTHRGKIVKIQDFQADAEQAFGLPLDWFFEEWLTRTGIPRYRINSADLIGNKNGAYQTRVEVEQVNEKYLMPVDFEIETKKGSERRREEIRDAITTLTISTKGEPIKVTLDPDYWILKHPRSNEWEKLVTPSNEDGIKQ